MFEVKTEINGDTLNVWGKGRIDTLTAPTLEDGVSGFDGDKVVFDFEEVEYISSAGLRVLLTAKKKIGDVTVKNVSPAVVEIFEVTGFDDLLNIEPA